MNKEYLDKLKRASMGNTEALESLEMCRREAIDQLQNFNDLAWLSSIKKVLDEFVPLKKELPIKEESKKKQPEKESAENTKQLRLFE